MRRAIQVLSAVCALLSAVILFGGCSDAEKETLTGPSKDTTYTSSLDAVGKYSGSVTGRVFSAADNSVLTGVTVVITGDQEGNTGASRTVVTDANGYYQFMNLALGDYLLTVQPLAGFSGKREAVQVVVPAGHTAYNDEADLRIDVKKDFDLLPLTANVSGTVYVEKEKVLAKTAGNSFSAPAAVVQVYLKNEIPDRYTDTANAGGAFAFANLPATAFRSINAQIIYLPYTDGDGTRFASKTDSSQLQEGSNVLKTAYLNTYQEPFVLLKSNVSSVAENSVALNSTILLIMSSNVDASRLTNLALVTSGGKVFPVTVSVGHDSAVVTPTLLLNANTRYYLLFQLFSTDGRASVLDTVSFSTVKGLTIQSVNYYVTDLTKDRIDVNQNIVVTFSMAPVIDPTQTKVTLNDAVGLIQTTTSITGNVMTIRPNYNLKTNTRYIVDIANLKSGVAGDNFNWTDTVYTKYTTPPVSVVTGLSLQDATFKANYNTLGIPVKWNRSSDAAFYNIYVKNSAHPAWLLLTANKGIGDNFSNIQRHSVSLNSTSLDPIINGATIEPFGLGSVCSLKVVPVNVDGIEGAAATQALFGIGDLIQPEIVSNPLFTTKTDVNMNNISGASVTIDFTVEFTEYMNTSGTPNLAIVGGGFPTVTFSSWAWGATEGSVGKNIATFQMTIPNGINLDTKDVSVSNIQDQSANSISTSVTIRLTDN